MTRIHKKRGAALVMAIAILAIILAIVVAFYTTSRLELTVSTNVSNAVRADFNANAGLALAMAFLNHDLLIHSTYTSLDFAAFTYFNGAWVAGKRWATVDGESWVDKAINGESLPPPYIDMTPGALPDENPTGQPVFSDSTSHWLYIPRFQGLGAAATLDYTGDFVVDPDTFDIDLLGGSGTNFPYAKNIVDLWTDVDNDDDGYRDSIWIPIPADLRFGARDMNQDGIVDADGDGIPDDGFDLPGDGIDNNLDGFIDEQGELATFAYWGGQDGLDNDGDGAIDEADEQRVFLTVPLGSASFTVANAPLATAAYFELDYVPDAAAYSVGPGTVDRLDNDQDLLINNSIVLTYNLNQAGTPWSGQNHASAISVIAQNDSRVKALIPLASTYTGSSSVVFARGEPVTELIGRVAVLIRDEASKVNLNTAGGHRQVHTHAYDIALGDAAAGDLVQAINQGVTTREYDTRVLPEVGPDVSLGFWQYLNGAPFGLYSPADDWYEDRFALDATLPGYGGADDNGNALALSLDGIDNDGDGLVDEGVNPAYPELFGQFEGRDEPGEHRHYRPYRNYIAERDGVDNDQDTLLDEIGEIGDTTMRSEAEAVDVRLAVDTAPENVAASNAANFARENSAHISAYPTDKNDRHAIRGPGAPIAGDPFTGLGVSLAPTRRGITGLKLDYNYAQADAIQRALYDDWYYAPMNLVRPEDLGLAATEINTFSEGLRVEGVNFFGTPIGVPAGIFEEDPLLRAGAIGATVHDFRDTDHTLSTVTSTIDDNWWRTLTGEVRNISYTNPGVESIRINEIMVRPVRRIEAEMMVPNPDNPVTDQAISDLYPTLQTGFNPNAMSLFNTPDFTVTAQLMEQVDEGPLAVDATPDHWNLLYQHFLFGTPIQFDFNGDGLYDRTNLEMGGSMSYIAEDYETDANNPNAIMYEFRPGPGLPPGRYYLTFNSQIDTRIPYTNTVTPDPGDLNRLQGDDLVFVVKYVSDTGNSLPSGKSTGTSSILEDINTGALDDADPIEQNIFKSGSLSPNGGVAPGGPENAWVWLATDAARTAHIFDLGLDPSLVPPGYLQDTGFTVEIPPYDEAGNDFRLQVAIYKQDTSGTLPLAINFFDFSQEVDHEWVEIVNVAQDDPTLPLDQRIIDLSNWDLEVGTGGETRQIYSIPQGTRIAPGGKLLLGFNTVDAHDESPAWPNSNYAAINDRSVFYHNGIGLSAYNQSYVLNSIPLGADPVVDGPLGVNTNTIPHIPPIAPETSANYTAGFPVGESVFWRPSDADFVDDNGDGLADTAAIGSTIGRVDDVLDSTVGQNSQFGATGNAATNALDRVVALVPQSSNPIRSSTNPADPSLIAEVILNGGVFPNYPERDIDPDPTEYDPIDNDGDLNILASDGIDNNGNGYVDEPFEGANEGRWYRHPDNTSSLAPPGYAVSGTFPAFGRILANMYEKPGSYRLPERWSPGDPTAGIPVAYDTTNTQGVVATVQPVAAHPERLAAPEWKAYVEKRWYPGDAVKVTLYEGPAFLERVADQVSYTEQDVMNRWITDARTCNLIRLNTDAFGVVEGVEPASLHASDVFGVSTPTRFWPEDNMSVDFYRSLERKHPLYRGDLHGTSNRWEATDGAYDDWGAPAHPRDIYEGRYNGSNDPPLPFASANAIRMYAHQFNGSPLRMNYWQRHVENAPNTPGDVVTAGQFTDPGTGFGADAYTDYAIANATIPYPDPAPADVVNNTTFAGQRSLEVYELNRGWTLRDYARVRNRNLASTGNLATMPMFTLNRTVFDIATANGRTPSLDTVRNVLPGETGDVSASAVATASQTPAEIGRNDFTALAQSGALAPQLLNVAQAEIYPLWPTYSDLLNDSSLMAWQNGTPPLAWSPLFLFPYTSDDTGGGASTMRINEAELPLLDVPLAYLYYRFTAASGIQEPPIPGDTGFLTPAQRAARWPLLDRAMTYVSANPFNFDPYDVSRDDLALLDPDTRPSETLFVWDGADGLENGQYDMYIVTAEPLDSVRQQSAVFSAANNTSMHTLNGDADPTAPGIRVLDSDVDVPYRQMAVDVEVFTDRDGDGQVWDQPSATLGGANIPRTAPNDNFDRGQFETSPVPSPGSPARGDSFGMIEGVSPDSSGVIHYGMVRVEGNYLAVLVRNWAPAGAVNRFTRVVLAPKQRESGRININTAIANFGDRASFDGNNEVAFNPIIGVPGVLGRYDTFSGGIFYPPVNFDPAPSDTTYYQPALGLAAQLQEVRESQFDWIDGRYFRYPSDLFAYSQERRLSATAGAVDYDWNTGFLQTTSSGETINERLVFDESVKRFSRMSNLITTRSDVFEIFVTAQSGYLSPDDVNGDGAIDYRNDFVTTGEKRIRVVYER